MLESLEDRLTPSVAWTVNLTTDTGGAGGQQNGQNAGDLRYCVTHAATGDTINFDSTVFNQATAISLTQGEIGSSQSLTIQNTTGQQITINAQNNATNKSRIFDFSGTNLSETISNLNFINGNAPGTTEPHAGEGGAIYAVGSLTLNNDSFTQNNAADFGGAVYDVGSLTLSSDNFSQNTAGTAGGAVYDLPTSGTNGNVTVNGPNAQFMGNHAGSSGGAVYVGLNNAANNVVLNKVAFTGNSVGQAGQSGELGGAVAAGGLASTTFQITASNFTNNFIQGSGDGGAIYTSDQLSFLYNALGDQSTFNSNTATNGGAIAYEPVQNSASSMSLVNVTFASNSAANGGAVYSKVNTNTGQVNMTITGSLFNGNKANIASSSNFGAGLYVNSTTSGSGSSSLAMTNDTFYQNNANFSSDTNGEGGGIVLALTNTGTGSNTAVLTSLTVYQNQAEVAGGGLWISLTGAGTSTANVTLRNSIIAGNTISNSASSGPDVFFTDNGGDEQRLQFISSGVGAGYNLIGIPDGGAPWQDATNIIGSVTAPANPYLSTGLANNGGPTQTIAAMQPPQGAQGAWHNGDPTLLTGGIPGNLDQRGFRRTTYVTIGAEDPDAVSS